MFDIFKTVKTKWDRVLIIDYIIFMVISQYPRLYLHAYTYTGASLVNYKTSLPNEFMVNLFVIDIKMTTNDIVLSKE